MPDDWTKHLIRAIGLSAHHARQEGNHGLAGGLTLIGLGIITMPIPFIGLPLLLGVWKMCK